MVGNSLVFPRLNVTDITRLTSLTQQSRQFKDAFCADVVVEFIGVFDTVSSVGILGTGLPFTSSNHEIKYFRHAMALDERRARFKVNHWQGAMPKDRDGQPMNKKSVRKGHEHEWKNAHDVETDVKEVWFAGGHVRFIVIELALRLNFG